MAHVLVTGATGFIGGHLVRALCERGHRVRCLVRRTSQLDALRQFDLELCESHVLDPAGLHRAVQGTDCVFHLAGLTCALDLATLLQVNGQGTAHVAEACAAQPSPPVLVVVSSIAAAGPTRRGSVRPDDAPPNPVSHYGASKRAGELAAARCADRVPTTVVRPGIVFGPGDKVLLSMFRSVRRWHVHAIAGLSSPPLSLIHVTELVELLERAAERGQRLSAAEQDGSRRLGYYFACRPEYPDYLEFGRMLHEAVGNRFTAYLHFPTPIPWLVGGVGEVIGRLRRRSLELNVDKIREAMADSWACSCARAQRDLGYAPRQPLQEQLRLTAQWYRQHGWL